MLFPQQVVLKLFIVENKYVENKVRLTKHSNNKDFYFKTPDVPAKSNSKKNIIIDYHAFLSSHKVF